MKRTFRFILLLAVTILANSCAQKDNVEITDVYPTGQVDRLTTFTIEFSKNLAPVDKQGIWLTDNFVEFDPPLQGKFKWTSSSTLIFSPDYPLQPIQDYTAKVTSKVLYDKELKTNFEKIEFHTPSFDVTKAEFFWSLIPNQSYQVSVKANIYFNYEVVPDQLKKYLLINIDRKKITDFTIVSNKSSKVIALNLGQVDQTNKTQNIEIVVEKGLQSVIGKKSLEDERSFKQTLPPITRLAITGVSSGFSGKMGWIRVSTTQKVIAGKLKEFVSIKPKRDISFSAGDNSFRIDGNFDKVKSIELSIKKGLPGLYGGELEFDFEQVVSLVNLKPSIKFTDRKGKYLMLSGTRKLQLNIINVKEADVEVSEVYKNNLIHFLNQNRYHYYDDYYYNDSQSYQVRNFGKTIYTEKLKLKNQNNWQDKVEINLSKALNQKYKGIYAVNVRSAKDRWINDGKVVAISDLAIITKKAADEIVVFVNSIGKAEPVEGVKVSVISSNNQTLVTGTTDEDGVVSFENLKEEIKGFNPRMVIAELGEDFNFIDLNETLIETSRFDVGGIVEYSNNYNAFIYGDRNLYRPGETVYVSAIVRNNKIEVVKEVPVIIKVISPTGKVFDEFKKDLNEQGSFDLSFSVPDYAQTGEYILELHTGSNELIGIYRFSIEDFVPDKIRLTVKPEKDHLLPGQTLVIKADAEFLFGAKAAGLKYQVDIQMNQSPFRSKKFPGFSFANYSGSSPKINNVQMDGTFNDSGKASIKYIIPRGLRSRGIIKGFAYVSVFDLTGRTVNRVAAFEVHPNKYYLGLKAPGYYFATNETLNFKVAGVNDNDEPINKMEISAALIRYEWKTVLKKDYSGKYYYTSEKSSHVEWRKNYIVINGQADISFAVNNSGSYALQVSKKGDSRIQKKSFYAYGWGRSTASSFEVDKEGRVEIVSDKEKYEPGEEAKILFKSPFAGRMLVTFERDGIYDYKFIDVNDKSAEITVPIEEKYMPNVYVTATLFKKHSSESTSPFLVGHGFKSIKVEKKENLLPISIEFNKKVKPLTKQRIKIKTISEKNVYVTLAAVDEGILQVKNYKTPEPYSYMYAKRRLKVSSYDLYKLLLPEIASSSPGGDALAKQLKKRTNPISAKRFNLLAIWSGIKRTNSDGEVTISLDIPQFNGEVRLMAVAYTDNRFGSAEEQMKVADDLIIEPEIPRFLSVGDSLLTKVTLINNTSSGGTVNLNLEVEGPLEVISGKNKEVYIDPNATNSVDFTIRTTGQIGKGKIKFSAGGIAKVKNEIEIGVRPISPLVSETGSGNLKAGKKLKINIPGKFLRGTQHTQLTLSKFPAVKFAKQLKYLIGYPYGCLEQTVSKIFPQIYFEDMAKLIAPEYYRTNNPVYYVKEGIRKIETMQLYDGSISYWQGGTHTNWWSTVYAAHFLVEAKKAGYNVSDNVLDKLLLYISKRAKEKSTYDYIRYRGNSRTVVKIANKEIVYSLYILALAGEGDISTMNYYRSRPHLLSKDAQYLLAGAYALMGKLSNYREALPREFLPENTERLTGGSFDSEIRANAIMLNVLLEVDPENEQIPYIIKFIADRSRYMYSTQERAFAFVALGKAASRNRSSNITVKIKTGGKLIEKFNGKDITISDIDLNDNTINLSADGEGEVYYFWNTEGIKINEKVKEEDSYMKIRRKYYDYRTRNEISNNKFEQGQLIVCKILLTGFDRSAKNIVISDLVPAGFEIENPRLNASTNLKWTAKNRMSVEYLDVRDDRLLIFTSLRRNKTTEYVYMLRAVSRGKFQLPVIGAEAMYDREYHSFNGAGLVSVK